MNTAQGSVASATIDEAVEWYLRNRSQELGAAERQEFAAWLRASPLNVREYLAIAALSNDLPSAADASPKALEALLERSSKQTTGAVVAFRSPRGSAPPSPRRFFTLAATLACLVVGAGGYWAFRAASYATSHGEQRTIRLVDGSLLQLNSSSKVTVRFSDQRRRIDLDRGQLMLSVFHDPVRPLSVRAGDTEVLAVGTKFDVYRKPDEVTVTVVEGRVLVRSEGAADRSHLPAIPLSVGQQVRLTATVQAPEAVAVDLPTATAWLQGNIKFFRKPLAEVAAEFNRYSAAPVDIDGAALRELRVSGVFNAYDIDSFVEFVRRLEGVEVRRSSGRIRIVSRSSPAS